MQGGNLETGQSAGWVGLSHVRPQVTGDGGSGRLTQAKGRDHAKVSRKGEGGCV